MRKDAEAGSSGQESAETRVGWIYKLNKEELTQNDLETGGTVEELRRRVVKYFRTEAPRTQPTPTLPTVTTPEQPRCKPNFEILDQLRKLNLKFDGKTDPAAFLEKLVQIQEDYGTEGGELLKLLAALLLDRANQWYTNYRHRWAIWYDFLEEEEEVFFFPPDYRENLEEEVSRKVQSRQERARNFIVDMQTLIRRHGGYSTEREISCIYKRLRPEYRQYIKKHDITSISDLLQQTYASTGRNEDSTATTS